LALCKIHHAAFDQDLLGIRPDLVVVVRRDVQAATDGPMLTHGLQAMDGVHLPRHSYVKTAPARP
jgi:putative restriction endonuclease